MSIEPVAREPQLVVVGVAVICGIVPDHEVPADGGRRLPPGRGTGPGRAGRSTIRGPADRRRIELELIGSYPCVRGPLKSTIPGARPPPASRRDGAWSGQRRTLMAPGSPGHPHLDNHPALLESVLVLLHTDFERGSGGELGPLGDDQLGGDGVPRQQGDVAGVRGHYT